MHEDKKGPFGVFLVRLSSAYGIWLNGAFAHKRPMNIQKNEPCVKRVFRPINKRLLIVIWKNSVVTQLTFARLLLQNLVLVYLFTNLCLKVSARLIKHFVSVFELGLVLRVNLIRLIVTRIPRQ